MEKKINYKLVMFDMDDTLLEGRTIFAFAREKGFRDQLHSIINSNLESYEKTIEIAKLLAGMNSNELLEIFRKIPLRNNVENVIQELKKKNITTAIATNSYNFVAEDLQKRLDIDYIFANNLIIKKDIVTGEIEINNKDMRRCNGGYIYSICKGYILNQLCNKLNISLDESIAIGDGRVDIGMIKKAGIGIAFNAPSIVKKNADISTDDISVILEHV
jgi:phosphoserine phosphatase